MKKYFLLLSVITCLMACEGTLTLVPITQITANYPQFNVGIRTVGGVEVVKLGQKIRYQLYIKQLDFERLDTDYTLTFQPSGSYDGNVTVEAKSYRPKDWILISYKKLLDNTTELTYQPIAPTGTYTLTFTLQDPAKVSQTITKTITVTP